MIKIAVTGATGRMGKEVITAINADPNCKLAIALIRPTSALIGTKVTDFIKLNNKNHDNQDLVFTDSLIDAEAFDVVVDFSLPIVTINYLSQCLKLSRPMVVATTGFSEADKNSLREAAQKIPILFAPNMSLGVNICYNLLELCAKAIGVDWQVAISEIHHKHKKDAPSGTALKMGEVITKFSGIEKSEIQFNSVRAGDVVGEHTVSFIGDGERIEITHCASNRQAFAKGALMAAKWLINKKPGLYTMQDVIQGHLA